MPSTPRQDAERACEDLLVLIRDAARDGLQAGPAEADAHDAVLMSLVGRYAACAHAAGSPAEQMLKPLKSSLGGYFYECTGRADALLRHALLSYFDLADDATA